VTDIMSEENNFDIRIESDSRSSLWANRDFGSEEVIFKETPHVMWEVQV